MKKLKAKPELYNEVRKHNTSVVKAMREFQAYSYLENARKQLVEAVIRPRSEMEGRGLRKTYVAIGREWMQEARLENWRKSNQRVIKQEVSRRTLRASLTFFAFLFLLFNVLAVYHTVREDIIPAFGDNMKKLQAGELAFEDLSRFANTVIASMGTDDFFRKMFPKGMSLPPDIQMRWRKRFDSIRTAKAPKVKSILLDPKRKNVYHVLFEAESPGRGELEFRLQCEKRGVRYAFLALE